MLAQQDVFLITMNLFKDPGLVGQGPALLESRGQSYHGRGPALDSRGQVQGVAKSC